MPQGCAMLDARTLIVAVLAGFGVVAATAASRRIRGPLGGVLAASPVTPTAALVLFDKSGSLIGGMASIAATLLAILVGLLIAQSGRHLWPLAGIIPMALVLSRVPPTALALVCVGVAVAMAFLRVNAGAGGRPRPLPVPVRFLAGAIPVGLVAVTVAWFPQAAPLVAVFPVVYVSCALAAHRESPELSLRILEGGGAGSLGVVAFVFATGAQGLWAGWFAFFVVAASWATLTRAMPRRGRLPRRQATCGPQCDFMQVDSGEPRKTRSPGRGARPAVRGVGVASGVLGDK